MLMIVQGYVDFGRFDKFNYFVAGSGHVDLVQVSPFGFDILIHSFIPLIQWEWMIDMFVYSYYFTNDCYMDTFGFEMIAIINYKQIFWFWNAMFVS